MGLLSDENRRELAEAFRDLDEPVMLRVFTQDAGPAGLSGFECDYCSETRQIVEELGEISDRIVVEVHDFLSDTSARELYGVERIPAIVLVGPDGRDSGARFYGVPAGYEMATLIRDIVMLSTGRMDLASSTIEALGGLTEDVRIQVFVTPTCPYCPGAAVMAHQLAMASDRIHADVVEATEFPELVQRFGVMGVPKIVLNESLGFEGAVPEEVFLSAVLQAGGVGMRAVSPAR